MNFTKPKKNRLAKLSPMLETLSREKTHQTASWLHG